MQFNPFPNVRGAFLGRTPDDEEKSWVERSVQVKQIHGDACLQVHSQGVSASFREREADALFTTQLECALAVRTADCVPILFAHPEGLIGAVHAGWRGTLAGILEKTLEKVSRARAWDSLRMSLAIGPSICGDCYEVGSEVAEQFDRKDLGEFVRPGKPGKYFLDLKGANRSIALKLGIPSEQIEISTACTLEDEARYFSHRGAVARGEPNAGRNFSIIEIIPVHPR